VERFDANSYVKLSLQWIFLIWAKRRNSIRESGPIAMPLADRQFHNDWLFPPEQSLELTNALIALGKAHQLLQCRKQVRPRCFCCRMICRSMEN